MKIKHKNKKQKIILSILILAVAIFGCFYFFTHTTNTTEVKKDSPLEDRKLEGVNYSPATEDQVNASDSAKKQLAKQDNEQEKPTKSLTVDLVAFKKSDGSIKVTANIQNITTSSGNCKLTATKGNTTKTYQSDIVPITDYSTCKGFDISGLDTGTWQIQIDITSGDYTGNTTTSVEI